MSRNRRNRSVRNRKQRQNKIRKQLRCENLESRQLLTIAGAVTGMAVDFSSDNAADTINFSVTAGGLLQHNNPGGAFNSATDLDSTVAGDQTLMVNAITSFIYEDGTEDEITMYGGMTTNAGQAGLQVFPADAETQVMIPAASGNVWWVTLDTTTFTYNLRRLGTERIFTISFDLSQSIKNPEAPWGWKE